MAGSDQGTAWDRLVNRQRRERRWLAVTHLVDRAEPWQVQVRATDVQEVAGNELFVRGGGDSVEEAAALALAAWDAQG